MTDHADMSALFLLVGIGGFLAGFYLVMDAFQNSARLSTNAGARRVGLGALCMAVGGFVVAFAFSPQP